MNKLAKLISIASVWIAIVGIWTGDWRYFWTGLLVFVIALIVTTNEYE